MRGFLFILDVLRFNFVMPMFMPCIEHKIRVLWFAKATIVTT